MSSRVFARIQDESTGVVGAKVQASSSSSARRHSLYDCQHPLHFFNQHFSKRRPRLCLSSERSFLLGIAEKIALHACTINDWYVPPTAPKQKNPAPHLKNFYWDACPPPHPPTTNRQRIACTDAVEWRSAFSLFLTTSPRIFFSCAGLFCHRFLCAEPIFAASSRSHSLPNSIRHHKI